MFVPLVAELCGSPPQHGLERLIETFDHAVAFRMVGSRVEFFYTEEVADVSHQVLKQIGASI